MLLIAAEVVSDFVAKGLPTVLVVPVLPLFAAFALEYILDHDVITRWNPGLKKEKKKKLRLIMITIVMIIIMMIIIMMIIIMISSVIIKITVILIITEMMKNKKRPKRNGKYRVKMISILKLLSLFFISLLSLLLS